MLFHRWRETALESECKEEGVLFQRWRETAARLTADYLRYRDMMKKGKPPKGPAPEGSHDYMMSHLRHALDRRYGPENNKKAMAAHRHRMREEYRELSPNSLLSPSQTCKSSLHIPAMRSQTLLAEYRHELECRSLSRSRSQSPVPRSALAPALVAWRHLARAQLRHKAHAANKLDQAARHKTRKAIRQWHQLAGGRKQRQSGMEQLMSMGCDPVSALTVQQPCDPDNMAVVSNLMARFPSATEAQVITALSNCGYHGSVAARELRKNHQDKGTPPPSPKSPSGVANNRDSSDHKPNGLEDRIRSKQAELLRLSELLLDSPRSARRGRNADPRLKAAKAKIEELNNQLDQLNKQRPPTPLRGATTQVAASPDRATSVELDSCNAAHDVDCDEPHSPTMGKSNASFEKMFGTSKRSVSPGGSKIARYIAANKTQLTSTVTNGQKSQNSPQRSPTNSPPSSPTSRMQRHLQGALKPDTCTTKAQLRALQMQATALKEKRASRRKSS